MKLTVKNFKNLFKNTLFKVKNKTINNLKFTYFKRYFNIKNFNNLIQEKILWLQSKNNNKFKISNFNKFLISFISLLFLYLFYLSIPVLYNKTWVQNTIQQKLQKEFKTNFSLSSDISYFILPAPHFLIKDSKIFIDKNLETTAISEIKNLKVFLSQKNFFNKKKMNINQILIDNANFLPLRESFKFLGNYINNKFSNKNIKVKNSKIFFKNNLKEIIAIIKLDNGNLFFDNQKKLNLLYLKGEVFNIPFILNFNKDNISLQRKVINIDMESLKLNIYNESSKRDKNSFSGMNIISLLNSKISTEYNLTNDFVNFKSNNSRIQSSKINYTGELSTNPFDLKLNIDLGNYDLRKILNSNSLLLEFFKNKILFNENISLSTTITSNSASNDAFFQSKKINLNILNGQINFNKSNLSNKDIGSLLIENSSLYFDKKELYLNTDIIFDIKNSKKLFSFLQTSKKSRKPMKNVFMNIDYSFLNDQIKFNSLKIDNNKIDDELITIIEGLNDYKMNNLIKSKRILNKFISAYDG